ncbi:MAG TPA: MTH1187 family thiamine-binding protein [Thermoguttaceae bacterium]
MILLEFSMFPIDKGESLSPFVARSLDIIDRSGLDYRCHAMGTEIEGEFDQVMKVVRDCFQAMAADCNRIECSIKFDYRKGRSGLLQAKVDSVEKKLGRPLKK